jgi:hypothetical protein
MRHKQNKGCHGQVEIPEFTWPKRGSVTDNAFPLSPTERGASPSAPLPRARRTGPPGRRAYFFAAFVGALSACDLGLRLRLQTFGLGAALGVRRITRASDLSPQCGDQSHLLTCPPNIVRTEHNAFVRSKLRLVRKSVLEARRGRWVRPKVARIETHRGTAGQKASSE